MSIKISDDDVVTSIVHFSLSDVAVVVGVSWLVIFSAVTAAIISTRYIVW